MEQVSMIKPTSKAALKQQCLMLSNLDVAKAEKMYDFLIKGVENIPDLEPGQTPFIENFGKQASGVLDWFRKNQDMLTQGYDVIRNIVQKKGITASPTAEPLPTINP